MRDGLDETLASGASAHDISSDDTIAPAGAARDGSMDDTIAPELASDVSTDDTIAPAGCGGSGIALEVVERSRYIEVRELARGGMGRIRIAHDRRLDRDVAIKELLFDSPESRGRFEREVRITAKLQHPAIVNVLEAGCWPGGEPFYVMKLVDGETLDRVIERKATRVERIGLLPHVIDVVEALAFAHSRFVLHRDLKPGNVLVGRFGETVVIDWGLARTVTDHDDAPLLDSASPQSPDATVAGAVLGTPAYMAPEQAAGERVDARADVYALGAMLYHVIAGRAPVAATSLEEMLAKVRLGAHEPLATVAPDLPRDLVAIVDKAMALDAEERYATAQELAEDLLRFQNGQLVGAQRYTSWQLLRRWVSRHRAAVTVAAVALAVTATLSVIGVRQLIEEQEATVRQRDVATRHRTAAEDFVSYLLVDVADRLAAIGDVELRSHVASKVGEYYATNTPQTLAESRKRVQALFALGTALQEQNKLDDAIVHYRSALAIANDIAHQPPTDLEVRADALRIRASIAQAMAIKGQIAEAEQEHHALVARHEELVAIGPSIARRRELALARTRLGAILLQRGSLEAALAEARSARDLLNAVPPSSRDDATMEAEWHTRHLLGDIAARQNDPTAAVVEFRAAVDLSERLASAASRDVKRIVRQATSQQRVGDMHFKLGQYAESLAAAERALEIQESLAMRDPANSRWQHAYAAAHMRVANARAARKEYGQALTHELAALDVIKRLVAHDPANVDWQIQLAVFHLAIHSLLSAKQDDAGDEQHVRAALVTLEAIVERNPAQSKVLRLAADAYGQLDQILAARGELEPAMLAAENAVRRARQLSEVDPSRLDVLARTSERHGDLLLERRDNANALVAYRATWTQYDQLSKKGPHFRVDAARARRKLGIAGNDRGELEKARDELERLISEAPENRPAAKELASVRAALDRCCKPR